MKKGEFEDLGREIWMRVLNKTWQSSDSFNEKHGSYSNGKSRPAYNISMPGQKY